MSQFEATFSGTIVKGKFHMDFPGHWRAWCQHMEGKRITIEADVEKQVRSNRQNRFWWGKVLKEFRDLWSKGRAKFSLPPYTKDNTHSVLVQALVGSEPGALPGTVLHVPTSEMDSETFAKMMEEARELALFEYGLHIPEPDKNWRENERRERDESEP